MTPSEIAALHSRLKELDHPTLEDEGDGRFAIVIDVENAADEALSLRHLIDELNSI